MTGAPNGEPARSRRADALPANAAVRDSPVGGARQRPRSGPGDARAGGAPARDPEPVGWPTPPSSRSTAPAWGRRGPYPAPVRRARAPAAAPPSRPARRAAPRRPGCAHRLRKDGSLVAVSVTISPIRDSSGALAGQARRRGGRPAPAVIISNHVSSCARRTPATISRAAQQARSTCWPICASRGRGAGSWSGCWPTQASNSAGASAAAGIPASPGVECRRRARVRANLTAVPPRRGLSTAAQASPRARSSDLVPLGSRERGVRASPRHALCTARGVVWSGTIPTTRVKPGLIDRPVAAAHPQSDRASVRRASAEPGLNCY